MSYDIQYLKDVDFTAYPKFRHNLWSNLPGGETTFLTAANGYFKVPTREYKRFEMIRPFCNGLNSIDDIAVHANIPKDEVTSIVNDLAQCELLHRPVTLREAPETYRTLLAACRIWAEQLDDTTLGKKVIEGKSSAPVLKGWLLETYHYIKEYPNTLGYAASKADGELKELLLRYEKEERGHEEFVMQSLLKLGLKRDEVEHSIPLVSTQTIAQIMHRLIDRSPSVVLAIAAIIEAADFSEAAWIAADESVAKTYQAPLGLLKPLAEHARVDYVLGHGDLLQKYGHLIQIAPEHVDEVFNGLHDLKHAFDLQKLEIQSYYTTAGNYVPRQFVSRFAI